MQRQHVARGQDLRREAEVDAEVEVKVETRERESDVVSCEAQPRLSLFNKVLGRQIYATK